jgi:outer membrane protein TolC
MRHYLSHNLVAWVWTNSDAVNLANAIDTEKSNQLVFTSQTINTIVSVVSAYYQLVEAYNS